MPWTPTANLPINYHIGNRTSDPMFSVKQEKNIEYTERVEYLHVSSVDRDTVAYPSVNEYRFVFEDTFKNVKAIRMIGATIPNQNSILDNPEVIIEIEEFNHITFSSKNINKGFAVLPLKSPSQSVNGFINPEMACNLNSELVFRTPLAKLNSMTITIKDIYGEKIDFDEPTGSIEKQFQNTFLFKITTMEKDRNALNHRNVF